MGRIVRFGEDYSGFVEVDNTLSTTSSNPVQNKIITNKINKIIPLILEYNSTSTYSVNDYCIYNNNLYRCINNISTPESFNTSNWELVTVISDLTTIFNTIGNINTVLEEVL